MKDFLNFTVTASPRPTERGVEFTIRHKKNDSIAVKFTTGPVHPNHLPDFLRRVMRAWTNKYFAAMRGRLSTKQKAFYDALVWFHKTEGRPPSYQEIMEVLGYSSKGTISVYVRRLIDKGWLWKDEDGKVIPVDIAAPESTE